ncbi:MAG TPA: glutathione S-transferase family protein [Polyangiaceae bacterium]|jgi:GST-like protein
MSIVFYQAPMSSASPVTWALAELGVPHENVKLDLAAGDQRKPEFLKLNPNGKVPTLVVDGTPMFEALAIMTWLGDRYGVERKLWPAAGDPGRLQALSWSTWAYVTFGPAIHLLNVASSPRSPEKLRSAVLAEHAKEQIHTLLGILDARLSDAPYLLGASFSLADGIVAAAVGYGARCGADIAPFSHVAAWLKACQDRPAWRVAAGAPPPRS